MNCFNVRELQILLRGRFFADLVNDTAHHDFLNNTMIGLRFKTNDLNSINPNTLLTYQYGLSNTPFTTNVSYKSSTAGLASEGGYSFITPSSFKYNTLLTLQGSQVTDSNVLSAERFSLTKSTPTDMLFLGFKALSGSVLY